jgi:hypothetical protein
MQDVSKENEEAKDVGGGCCCCEYPKAVVLLLDYRFD